MITGKESKLKILSVPESKGTSSPAKALPVDPLEQLLVGIPDAAAYL